MGNKNYSSTNSWRYNAGTDVGENGTGITKQILVTTFFNRSGVNNPSRVAQIRSIQNASTPLVVSFTKLKLSPPSCEVNYTIKEAPSWVGRQTKDVANGLLNTFDTQPVAGHYLPYDVSAEQRAVSALYRAIRNAHHQFQGGVFVGEFRKTALMIAQTATRLKKGVVDYLIKGKSLRRGRRPTPDKPLHNLYLENVFGWQPLIVDVKDGAKALGRLLYENDAVRFRAMGVGKNQIFQIPGNIDGPGARFLTNNIRTSESMSIYYGSFKGLVPASSAIETSLDRVVSMSGFDLASFIPTVWELLPYSFLVDYFINVGECLEAMNTDTSSIAWVTNVKKQTSLDELNIAYGMHPSAHITYGDGGNGGRNWYANFNGRSGYCGRQYTTITRSPLTAVPLMMPRFKLTGVSGKQFLNIGVLLTR